MANINRLFFEDIQNKRKARGGQTVAKKKPKALVLPTAMENKRDPPWWQRAPVLVHVDVKTGEVLVNRWPVSENIKEGDADSQK